MRKPIHHDYRASRGDHYNINSLIDASTGAKLIGVLIFVGTYGNKGGVGNQILLEQVRGGTGK
jgi:hypothetical protein